MKECFVCGEEARIFTSERWICKECYLELRNKENSESIGPESVVRPEKQMDLQLGRV